MRLTHRRSLLLLTALLSALPACKGKPADAEGTAGADSAGGSESGSNS